MTKKFLISILSLSLFLSLGTAFVLAEIEGEDPGDISGSNPINIKLDNPFKKGVGDDLFQLLETIVNKIVMPIGGMLAVLAFIYSGFLYVTAQGNDTKLATAHKALLYTSVGTAVLLGSWVIAQVI